MSFAFAIIPGSPVPIYQQIADQTRRAVASGSLSVGDPLPSVRALAEQLLVNPNTVARAYADLGRDGILEARVGRGVFVARKRQVFTREEAWRRLEPRLEAFVAEGMSLNFTPEELRTALENKLVQWKPSEGGQTIHE